MGLWLVAVVSHTFWLVALISWRLLGTMELCMPRVLKRTPRKMALEIRWHDLAHFCCAKFGHSKFRLFLISPSPALAPLEAMSMKAPFCRRAHAHRGRGPGVSQGSGTRISLLEHGHGARPRQRGQTCFMVSNKALTSTFMSSPLSCMDSTVFPGPAPHGT